MPITIQANKMQIRNNQGNYVNIDAVSDATTAARVAIINDAAVNGIAEATAAAQDAVNRIMNTVPLEYSQLSNNVKLLNNETIVLESGTFSDNDGTTKVTKSSRVRNIVPIPVSMIESITMPEGYSMWIFLLDKNFISITHTDWVTSRRKDDFGNAVYINFGIRNTANPSASLENNIDTIQNGIQFITRNEKLVDQVDTLNSCLPYKDLLEKNIIKNLVGPTPEKLYPLNLNVGAVVTASMSDGQTGQVINIKFYDSSKTQVEYYAVPNSSTNTSRSITLAHNVSYVSWNPFSSSTIVTGLPQLEYNSIATNYTPHITTTGELKEEIDEINSNIKKLGTICSTPDTSVSGYYINTLDGCGYTSSGTFALQKYKVKAGQVYKLKIDYPYTEGGCTYRFQTIENVPTSSTTAHEIIRGTPCYTAFNDYVTVPNEANWLIVVVDANTATTNLITLMPSVNDIKANTKAIDDIDNKTMLFGKNLVGAETNVFYPVYLNSGDIITISVAITSNNKSIIYFYDKNFNQIEYWVLQANTTSRTVTIVHDGIRFIRLSSGAFSVADSHPQIEIGNTATTYEKYKYPADPFVALSRRAVLEDDKYRFKLNHFLMKSSQYRKGNTSGTWYDRFVLAHITDNHVRTTFAQDNLTELCQMINDVGYDAVINSGDMTNAGSSTKASVIEEMDTYADIIADVSSDIPILATLGNHDANDSSNSYSNVTTKQDQWDHIYAPIKTKYSGIVWGDDVHYKHYHYYDVTKGSYVLRIISLDSLDHSDYVSDTGKYECQWNEVYSQNQIDWLCNTALNVPSGNYGIIINNHFPFAPHTQAYSDEYPSLNDGIFVQGWTMIPEIVQAWMNRTTLSKTFYDTVGTQNIIVNADFSSVPSSALFVCYMAGHTHSKNAYKVEEVGGVSFNQVMLCEDSSGQEGSALNRSHKYNNGIENTAASQITIDMAEKKIYRTAYGIYQHCSKIPQSETKIFNFDVSDIEGEGIEVL